MELRPISVKAASRFVAEHHRHHDPPQGAKFALAARHDGQIVGVALVGRPVSRMLDDGLTAEVTRVATDGTRNACSFLYARAKRAAQAMGYRKVITYTLVEESGASLRAVGWARVGVAGGGSWSKPSRPRVDHYPTQEKIRWECTLGATVNKDVVVRFSRVETVAVSGWTARLEGSSYHGTGVTIAAAFEALLSDMMIAAVERLRAVAPPGGAGSRQHE